MNFQTETGSIYEVEGEVVCISPGELYQVGSGRIRRLNGELPATQRVGENEWKDFFGGFVICIGLGVCIMWSKETTPLLPGSPEGSQPATVTSPVVKIWA